MKFRDRRGRIRFEIHPSDKTTSYNHLHVHDRVGNSLNKDLKVVSRRSEDAHIRYGDNQ